MSIQVDEALVNKEHRTSFTIWVPLFMSLFLFVFLALSIGKVDPEASMTDVLVVASAVISVVLVFVAFYSRKYILAGKLVAPTEIDDLNRRFNHFRTAMIVSMALYQAIGLFGFMIYMALGNRPALFIFIAAAVVLQLSVRPDRDKLAEYVAARRSPD